jgi:menaquinol-cytochrome c reductase iron-sulfur subunit
MDTHEDGQQPLQLQNGSRRSFLALLFGAAGTGMAAFLAIPMVRFIFYPLNVGAKESSWAEAGPVADLAEAKSPVRRTLELSQRDAWQETATQPVVYVIQAAGEVKAFSAICPHLGCSVAWHEDKEKFICPCHGGQFTADGKHCFGPPPRSLDTLETKVVDGKVMVRYEQFRPNVPDREVSS